MSSWYLRDASWWQCPDTRTPKKYHLANENGDALCGTQARLNADTEHDSPEDFQKCKRCQKLQMKNQRQN